MLRTEWPRARCVRDDGAVGEYRWGSERKCALLAYEGIVGSARD